MKKVYKVTVCIRPTEIHVIELVAEDLQMARILAAHCCSRSVSEIVQIRCVNEYYDGPDYIKTIDRIRP